MNIQFNKRLQEHLFAGYMWVERISKILLFCKISKSICISLGSDSLSHSEIKTTNAWPLKGLSNNRQSKQTKGRKRGKESKRHSAPWGIKGAAWPLPPVQGIDVVADDTCMTLVQKLLLLQAILKVAWKNSPLHYITQLCMLGFWQTQKLLCVILTEATWGMSSSLRRKMALWPGLVIWQDGCSLSLAGKDWTALS